MRKKSRKRGRKIFIYYVIAAILIFGVIYYTYSSYLSKGKVDADLGIAVWNIKVNEQNSNMTFDLSKTILTNTYSNNEIIPGTHGVLALELDFSEMEVATSYDLRLDQDNLKVPENLKLYADEAHTVEFNGFTGTTDLNTTKITRYIYWDWKYTTTDETSEWMGKDIQIGFNVETEQRTN